MYAEAVHGLGQMRAPYYYLISLFESRCHGVVMLNVGFHFIIAHAQPEYSAALSDPLSTLNRAEPLQ